MIRRWKRMIGWIFWGSMLDLAELRLADLVEDEKLTPGDHAMLAEMGVRW